MKRKEDTIKLLIASYCDSELLTTIKSALIQADNSERVHLAICYQSDDLETLKELKKIKNCRVVHLFEKDVRGSVYARYLCQKMIEDEKYIYQIDSHMRFVKHWDTKMIEQLESLNDKKAILSFYPPNYNEDMRLLPVDDKKFNDPTSSGVMYVNGFKSDTSYFLDINSKLIGKDSVEVNKQNAFISAGNLFTYSKAYKEVIFDCEMFFYGDELPMAIRLFTHGWNVYNPKDGYIYHQYVNKLRKVPPLENAMGKENERFKDLLNIDGKNKDLGIYGLGKERTLEDYQKFSGVNFKDRIIYMNGEIGDFDNKEYINNISYLQQKKIDKYLLSKKVNDIEVLIIDKFNDYKECMKSCLSTADDKNNIKFLIATTSEDCDAFENVKKIIHIKKDETYTKSLAKLIKNLGDCYVMLVDSSFRFAAGWDDYYCKNLDMCGKNSVLTSWVWKTNANLEKENVWHYQNVVKEFSKFNDLLPELRYNKSIDLTERKNPYQAAFISDGFVFCKSFVFKHILPDPSLSYEEHQYIYSVRLWTNGVNLYYPSLSYVVRTRLTSDLYEGIKNRKVISSLMGIYTYESKKLKSNYKYDMGNIRPLWSWYEYINVNYDSEKMKIIE